MSRAMDIFKSTPRTNCKECGYQTCMSFAVSVDNKGADLSLCPYIKDSSFFINAESFRYNTSGATSAGVVFGNVSNASTIYGQEVFHARQGHGYAAEQAEHLVDIISGKDATLTGTDLAKNGADRFVNGTNIQTKYCESGTKCISECFHDGKFRYTNPDGSPMQIEVPSDKYQAALKAMEDRIKNGEIPGVSDPADAKNIVKRGHFTYQQAKNIAKAGTIESIVFDSVNGAIIATSSFGISATLSFATAIWNGDDFNLALKTATYTGLKVGGTTFVTAVLAGQFTKAGLNSALVGSTEAVIKVLGPKGSAMLVNALRSGKNIYGGAAMKSAAKLLRGNIITSAASVVVLSSADIVNIFRSRVSGKQLFKNLTETTASVAGGTAGWLGGTTVGATAGATIGGFIGSVIPGAGTAVGAALGGKIGATLGGLGGSFAAGSLSGKAAHAVLDTFIEDDAKEMLRIIETEFSSLATDYLLTKKEAESVSDRLQSVISTKTLKDMFASKSRKQFAIKLLVPPIETVTKARPIVKLPSAEAMQQSLRTVLEEISDASNNNDHETSISSAVAADTLDTCTKEKITEDTTIQVFDSLQFSQKELDIGATFTVYGDLIFENCKVNLACGSQRARVELFQSASLKFIGCEITCPKYDENDDSLICSEDEARTLISFDGCTIFAESHLIFTVGSLQFNNCTILNAPSYTISVHHGHKNTVTIDNSLIQFDHSVPFGEGMFGSYGDIFNLTSATITNTRVISKEITPSPKKNVFSKDTSGVFSKGFDGKVKFVNCTIEGFEDNLIRPSIDNKGYLFDSCQFIGCGKKPSKYGTLRKCEISE